MKNTAVRQSSPLSFLMARHPSLGMPSKNRPLSAFLPSPSPSPPPLSATVGVPPSRPVPERLEYYGCEGRVDSQPSTSSTAPERLLSPPYPSEEADDQEPSTTTSDPDTTCLDSTDPSPSLDRPSSAPPFLASTLRTAWRVLLPVSDTLASLAKLRAKTREQRIQEVIRVVKKVHEGRYQGTQELVRRTLNPAEYLELRSRVDSDESLQAAFHGLR